MKEITIKEMELVGGGLDNSKSDMIRRRQDGGLVNARPDNYQRLLFKDRMQDVKTGEIWWCGYEDCISDKAEPWVTRTVAAVASIVMAILVDAILFGPCV